MSTIIKASGSRTNDSAAPVQSIAFSFDDMSQQANRYLTDVRAQAAQIVKDAQEQAKAIRKQAEQQGHQAALQAVERVMDDKVGKHIKTLLPALEQAVRGVEHARQEWLAYWQQNAVKLACGVAGRIVRRELSAHPEITLDWINEALQLAAGSAEVAIHLHPSDLEHLGRQAAELTKKFHAAAPAALIPDPEVSPGGCRVTTRFGEIDQQLETQLQRLEQELAGK